MAFWLTPIANRSECGGSGYIFKSLSHPVRINRRAVEFLGIKSSAPSAEPSLSGAIYKEAMTNYTSSSALNTESFRYPYD